MTAPFNPIKQLRTIAECWAYFRQQVIPPDAPPISVERAEMCFYSGAAFVFDQNIAIGEDSVTEAQGMAHLERLQQELRDYQEKLATRVIGLAEKRLPPTGRPS